MLFLILCAIHSYMTNFKKYKGVITGDKNKQTKKCHPFAASRRLEETYRRRERASFFPQNCHWWLGSSVIWALFCWQGGACHLARTELLPPITWLIINYLCPWESMCACVPLQLIKGRNSGLPLINEREAWYLQQPAWQPHNYVPADR